MKRTSGEQCLRVALIANLVLVVIKLGAGLAGHSQAFIADGVNSILDVVAGAVSWIGYRVASKPPDAAHQYGHQNAETIGAFLIGLAIFATGGVIVRDAIMTIWHGHVVKPAVWTVALGAGVIAVKTVLYFYTRRAARVTGSLVVNATATDHISDVVATSGVLVGVWGAQLGWPFLDPVAAFWVAGVILLNALRILRTNTSVLLGGAPPEPTIAEIRSTLAAAPGVLGLHRTKVRTAGARLLVDTEILVDGTMTVEEAHKIANTAGDRLLAANPAVVDVVVHVEPHTLRRAAEGADPLTPRARPQSDLFEMGGPR